MTHVLTNSFAENVTTAFKYPRSHCCIAVWNVAFDEVGTQQHGHTLYSDIVFESKCFAEKLASLGLLVDDAAFPRPCTMRVL
jgi:hypothetical protein